MKIIQKKISVHSLFLLIALLVAIIQILHSYYKIKSYLNTNDNIDESVLKDYKTSTQKNTFARERKKRLIFRNEPKINKTNAEFSACVMVKDENEHLPEWIAYHYTMLNLRLLITCVDPHSITSPALILEKWKNHTDFNFLIWNETHYPKFYYKAKGILDNNTRLSFEYKLPRYYVLRQRSCFSSCIRYLKSHRKTWTFFIDIDEYLTINPVSEHDSWKLFTKHHKRNKFALDIKPGLRKENVIISRWKNVKRKGLGEEKSVTNEEFLKMSQNSSNKIYHRRLKKSNSMSFKEDEITTMKHDLTTQEVALLEKRTELPTRLTKYTIADYIIHHENDLPFILRPCTVLPRLQFGALTEPQPKYNLTTYNYLHHTVKGGWKNRGGKCLTNVALMRDFLVHTPHRLNNECGDVSQAFPEHLLSVLRVNHYSRSKDAFLRRNDSRVNREFKGDVKDGKSDEILGWFDIFKDVIGNENVVDILMDPNAQ